MKGSADNLERITTSVKPTIKAINDILASFGFQGYKLAEGKEAHKYQILRSNGQPANETLSKGEKTFLTFLYFYHLLRGSISDAGTLDDRVVVFDDPVSSLDSNVLFIVSSLIRKLMAEVQNGSEIKQVIVLTHNVFFHKEVSFRSKTERKGGRKYWVVRKVSENSLIEPHYDKDPIKSSYDLLWAEIRLCDKTSVSTHLLQNSMRRILENYFKVLGGLDLGELDLSFKGTDQLICRTLLAWVHDGSHSIHDDLHMSESGNTAEMYIMVFRGIFEKTRHLPHYEMMMGEPIEVEEPLPV